MSYQCDLFIPGAKNLCRVCRRTSGDHLFERGHFVYDVRAEYLPRTNLNAIYGHRIPVVFGDDGINYDRAVLRNPQVLSPSKTSAFVQYKKAHTPTGSETTEQLTSNSSESGLSDDKGRRQGSVTFSDHEQVLEFDELDKTPEKEQFPVAEIEPIPNTVKTADIVPVGSGPINKLVKSPSDENVRPTIRGTQPLAKSQSVCFHTTSIQGTPEHATVITIDDHPTSPSIPRLSHSVEPSICSVSVGGSSRTSSPDLSQFSANLSSQPQQSAAPQFTRFDATVRQSITDSSASSLTSEPPKVSLFSKFPVKPEPSMDVYRRPPSMPKTPLFSSPEERPGEKIGSIRRLVRRIERSFTDGGERKNRTEKRSFSLTRFGRHNPRKSLFHSPHETCHATQVMSQRNGVVVQDVAEPSYLALPLRETQLGPEKPEKQTPPPPAIQVHKASTVSRRKSTSNEKLANDKYSQLANSHMNTLSFLSEHCHELSIDGDHVNVSPDVLSSLRWNDFSVDASPLLVKENDVAFYSAVIGPDKTIDGKKPQRLTLMVSPPSLQCNPLLDSERRPFYLPVLAEFEDTVPCELCIAVHESVCRVSVLPNYRPISIEHYSKRTASRHHPLYQPTAHERETCFIMIQLLTALKHLQSRGFEEVSSELDELVLLRSENRYPRLSLLPDSLLSDDESTATVGLCQAALKVLCSALHTQTDPGWGAVPAIRSMSLFSEKFQRCAQILAEEKTNSLTKAQVLMEVTYWLLLADSKKDADFNFDLESAKLWLDIERAKTVNRIVRTLVENDRRSLELSERYRIEFLLHLTPKQLCQFAYSWSK